MASNVKLNLIQLDIPAADLTAIDTAITTLETKLYPNLITLTAEQRSSYAKMGKREQIVREAVTAAALNAADIPASTGTAEAQADLSALDTYRPYFARIAKINQACEDSEMALGIDLFNFALRVYGVLAVSAPAALKELLDKMASFFSRGSRHAAASATAGATPPKP